MTVSIFSCKRGLTRNGGDAVDRKEAGGLIGFEIKASCHDVEMRAFLPDLSNA